MAAGGGGGIILAMIGNMRANVERPAHIAPPTVREGGLAQIGGKLLAQNDAKDFSDGVRAMAASHDRYTLMGEARMMAWKKEVEDTRAHKKARS